MQNCTALSLLTYEKSPFFVIVHEESDSMKVSKRQGESLSASLMACVWLKLAGLMPGMPPILGRCRSHTSRLPLPMSRFVSICRSGCSFGSLGTYENTRRATSASLSPGFASTTIIKPEPTLLVYVAIPFLSTDVGSTVLPSARAAPKNVTTGPIGRPFAPLICLPTGRVASGAGVTSGVGVLGGTVGTGVSSMSGAMAFLLGVLAAHPITSTATTTLNPQRDIARHKRIVTPFAPGF